MGKKFEIKFSSTSMEKRPAVSYKLREYYESFIEEKLFNNSHVKIKAKTNVIISIIFVQEGPRFTSEEIFLSRYPTFIKSENVKIFEIIIPLVRILIDGNILVNTITNLQEALTLYFTSTYTNISRAIMDEMWKEVNLDYIKSLPFPAPLNEQRYVSDIVRSDGSISFA